MIKTCTTQSFAKGIPVWWSTEIKPGLVYFVKGLLAFVLGCFLMVPVFELCYVIGKLLIEGSALKHLLSTPMALSHSRFITPDDLATLSWSVFGNRSSDVGVLVTFFGCFPLLLLGVVIIQVHHVCRLGQENAS